MTERKAFSFMATVFAVALCGAMLYGCGGVLHMVDIRTPNNPTIAGCHDATQTHETQCVVRPGSDDDHRKRETCVASNEDPV